LGPPGPWWDCTRKKAPLLAFADRVVPYPRVGQLEKNYEEVTSVAKNASLGFILSPLDHKTSCKGFILRKILLLTVRYQLEVFHFSY
jgi:hypothetical protein